MYDTILSTCVEGYDVDNDTQAVDGRPSPERERQEQKTLNCGYQHDGQGRIRETPCGGLWLWVLQCEMRLSILDLTPVISLTAPRAATWKAPLERAPWEAPWAPRASKSERSTTASPCIFQNGLLFLFCRSQFLGSQFPCTVATVAEWSAISRSFVGFREGCAVALAGFFFFFSSFFFRDFLNFAPLNCYFCLSN